MCAKGSRPAFASPILTDPRRDDNVHLDRQGEPSARAGGRRRPLNPLCLGAPLLLPLLGLLAGCLEGNPGGGLGEDREISHSEISPGDAAAPGGSSDTLPVRLRDDAGRELAFTVPPQRILSLVPSATAILLALEGGPSLVGRTEFDRQPELSHLPSVGGGLGASLERVLSVRPDLVIRFHGPSDRETAMRLDELGIPHLAVRPDRVDDVFRIVETLGLVLGASARARALTEALRSELEEVRRAAGEQPRRRVAILLGGNPPLVAGPGTFLHDLVTLAGGENLFADGGELYAPTSVEEILRRTPELLLLSDGSLLPAALAHLPVRRYPSDVEVPGVGVGSSARLFLELLHGDVDP